MTVSIIPLGHQPTPKSMPEQNAYRILNIRKGSTEKEIKQAYVDLVKKYDPELHTERFMVIQQAYEKLRDPHKRAREDIFTCNFVHGEFTFSKEEQSDKPEAEIRQQPKSLEEKLKDNPNDEAAKRELILCYMQLSWKCVNKKLWAEAIQQWTNVLNLDPTHLRAKNNIIYSYITLGYSYSMHGLNVEAIDFWERALQMNPDNPDVVHNLAIAYEQNGERAPTNAASIVARTGLPENTLAIILSAPVALAYAASPIASAKKGSICHIDSSVNMKLDPICE